MGSAVVPLGARAGGDGIKMRLELHAVGACVPGCGLGSCFSAGCLTQTSVCLRVVLVRVIQTHLCLVRHENTWSGQSRPECAPDCQSSTPGH